MALTIEEKYDEVRQLITMGKEKGYLLYEEVNDMLPVRHRLLGRARRHLLACSGRWASRSWTRSRSSARSRRGEEGAELDLTPGHARQDQRPRAHVPARDGHGAPAHARGRGRDRQAHRARQERDAARRSRARPWRPRKWRAWASGWGRARSAVRDAVVFNEEEVTEEKLEAKIKETLKLIGKVNDAHTRVPGATARTS